MPAGDEGALFERYHKRLVRVVALDVRTSRDNVEEACAFAWAQLLSHEVQREKVFSWLIRVASREAVRLATLDRGAQSIGHETEAIDPERLPSADNPAVTPERWRTALARLSRLSERERRMVAMRAFGWRYADIARELGMSQTRVTQILAHADARLGELEQREQPARTMRVARLRELEDNPPLYLREAIGRIPRINRRVGNEGLRRDWRRLALAIEDYRAAHGITDPRRALGSATVSRDQRLERDALSERIDRFGLEAERVR